MRKTVFATLLILAMSTFTVAQAGKKMESKPATGKSTEQALKDIENKWAAAALKGDTQTISAVVSDDWSGTNPEGKTQTKSEMIEDTKKAKLTKSSVDDIKVKSLGGDTAVVTGTWSGAGTGADGKAFDTTERWTDVFVKKNGEWKAVASQSTTVKKT
jgi:ketosteroid isomerase-like protein